MKIGNPNLPIVIKKCMRGGGEGGAESIATWHTFLCKNVTVEGSKGKL